MRRYRQEDATFLKGILPPGSKNIRLYSTEDGLKAIVSEDTGRLHMSVSRADRNPLWEEIREARETLLPLGKHFVMALPPPQHYVNTHPFCFHLWECLPEREADLIWTFEQM